MTGTAVPMDTWPFLKAEYDTLREEIRDIKARIFRLAGLGLVAVPSAYGLAEEFELDVLSLTLPAFIFIVLLLYLCLSTSLMRTGRYIRYNIEAPIRESCECRVMGWEHWLEQHQSPGEVGRRLPDQLENYFFYVLFLVYYCATVERAASVAFDRFEIIGVALVLGLYVALGLLFVAWLVYMFRRAHHSGEIPSVARQPQP